MGNINSLFIIILAALWLNTKPNFVSSDNYLATTPTCKTGFVPGKTPISLVKGAKLACVNTKFVKAGKKLLLGETNTCFACHSTTGIIPVKQMYANLKSDGFTLKPADISAAFTLHADLMSGATITAADAKNISHYLQSVKAAL